MQPAEDAFEDKTTDDKAGALSIEDQPTVSSIPLSNGEAAVEINMNEKILPPAGKTDPLPNRVDEVDISATMVTPAALQVKKEVTQPIKNNACQTTG